MKLLEINCYELHESGKSGSWKSKRGFHRKEGMIESEEKNTLTQVLPEMKIKTVNQYKWAK